jgi:hypothetical protein
MSNDEYQHQAFCKQMKSKEAAVNVLIQSMDKSKISDGYHTFGELYDHRNMLFVNLCKLLKKQDFHVWRSIKHSDGSMDKDWFIMGINKGHGNQITYHLPISMWDSTMWAETLDKAPDYDGHSSKDVLTRLTTLI